MAISISVIVPVYNGAEFIERCLRSIVSQSIASIDIIVVDDCSSDATVSLVSRFCENDSRVRLVSNATNSGAAYSRNQGLKLARGEFVGFVDADDWIEEEYFEKLYDEAVETGSDIVKGQFQKVFSSGVHLNSTMNLEIRKRLADHQFPGIEFTYAFWNAIYRRSLLERYKISFPLLPNGEDIVFMVKAMYYAEKFKCIDHACYYYYQRPNSLSRNISKSYFDSIYKHIDIICDFLDNSNISKEDYIDFFHNGVISNLLNYHLDQLKASPVFDFYVLPYMEFVKKILTGFKYSQDFLKKYPREKYKHIYYNPLDDLVKRVKADRLHSSQKECVKIFWFRLFGFLPLARVKESHKTIRIKLFGLNILKIIKS